MLEITKEIYNRTPHFPRLSLFKKDEKGIPRSTGKHKIKILKEKLSTGVNYQTQKEQEEIHYLVEENGLKKVWIMPTNHYLINRLIEEDVSLGDEIILEGKYENGKNVVHLKKVGKILEQLEQDDVAEDENSLGEEPPMGEGEDFFGESDRK